MTFLDPRLRHDTLPIGELPLCRLLLMNDANYPWCILVPRQAGLREVFDLDPTDMRALWEESALVARQMQALFQADKMNIATLGNVVAQLHMHVIARTQGDLAWPAPVWARHPASPYLPLQAQDIIAQLRDALSGHLRS